MDTGIVYVAVGSPYREECLISAASVKEHMPDVPITLMTDAPLSSDHVDSVEFISDPTYSSADVIESLVHTPYERTIFLDTDIYVDDDISELFSMLDSFDLGVVIDPTHTCPRDNPIPIVPETFPEFNTGLIAFQRNERTTSFFRSWSSLFTYHGSSADQPSFRDTVYLSDLRLLTLPPEYNCLYGPYPGYAYGKIKIFHGRLIDDEGFTGLSYQHDPAEARRILNSSHYARAFSWDGQFQIHQNRKRTVSLTRQFLDSIQSDGMIETGRKTAEYLTNRLASSSPLTNER